MQEPEDLCPPFIRRDSAQQEFQIRQMAAAICEVEWGGLFGNGTCPCCGSKRSHGHAGACPVRLALLPDQGVGTLKESLATSIQAIISHRHALEAMVATAVRELDDLDMTLTNIQDFLHLL